MQLLIDGIQYILDFFGMLADFVVQLVESLIHFLTILPACIQMVIGSIAYLPGEVTVFATLSVTISVIFIILGRSSTNG